MQKLNRHSTSNSKRLAKLGALVVLLALGLLIGMFVYLAYGWSEKLEIEKVRFTGLSYLKEKDLRDTVASVISKKKRKEINLEFIEKKVKNNKFVLDAVASFSNLTSIDIEIKERFPIAFFHDIDGSLLYIDSTGILFPNIMMTAFSDMPIVTGINRSDTSMLKQAVKIINQMRAHKGKFVYNLTSELNFEKNSNSFYIITSDLGIKVNFGKVNNFEEKIFKIEKFWNKWLITKNRQEIKEVDVRWKNQVIIT